MQWTVDCVSRIKSVSRLVNGMTTITEQSNADRAGGDLPVRVHIPWSSRGAGLTLRSAGLYDLDTRYIPDVLGLRAQRPEAAVVKFMSIKDNRCVRVLIPDDNVGHKGFSDVLLHDMADADLPYVAVSDLSALRLDWPAVIMSGMTRYL